MTTAPSGLDDPATAAAQQSDAVRTPRKPRGGAGRGTAWYRRLTPYYFLLIPVGLLLLLTFAPVINMFWYSATDWDGLDKTKNVVGLRQLRRGLHRPGASSACSSSASTTSSPRSCRWRSRCTSPRSCRFNTRFRNLFKGILFFPYLINGVAIGFDLPLLLPAGRHARHDALAARRSTSLIQQWLGDPDVVNFSLAGMSVWRYMGLNFVLFLGAIQSIPAELYEAAELDGANRWHQFRYIILPGIRPIIGLSLILAISGALSVFEIPFVMTGGANGTETFVIQTV